MVIIYDYEWIRGQVSEPYVIKSRLLRKYEWKIEHGELKMEGGEARVLHGALFLSFSYTKGQLLANMQGVRVYHDSSF